jgi:hypothetical protein
MTVISIIEIEKVMTNEPFPAFKDSFTVWKPKWVSASGVDEVSGVGLVANKRAWTGIEGRKLFAGAARRLRLNMDREAMSADDEQQLRARVHVARLGLRAGSNG